MILAQLFEAYEGWMPWFYFDYYCGYEYANAEGNLQFQLIVLIAMIFIIIMAYMAIGFFVWAYKDTDSWNKFIKALE